MEAWIIDDTSFPKKGEHSVGVQRQYCGERGKNGNCQALVSLSVANEAASLPVAHRLFLPESWAGVMARRRRAKVPDEVTFQTKPEIALDQMRAALAAGLPKGLVLADAGYGKAASFRAGIAALGLTYAVGISEKTCVWRPGEAPPPRPRKTTRGRWPKGQGPARHGFQPVQVKDLARELPPEAWAEIGWRAGANAALTGRFARLRVQAAPGGATAGADPAPEEWLLIEWPKDDAEPIAYWLSTLAPETGFAEHVRLTKLRWRIERDFLDLKQECGLGHYEGRGWLRLPPPHHPVHRGLRSPDHPARGDSPLRTPLARAPPNASNSRKSPTPRRRRSARSASCQTPSRPCTFSSWPHWQPGSPDVRSVNATAENGATKTKRWNMMQFDAVGITGSMKACSIRHVSAPPPRPSPLSQRRAARGRGKRE